MKFSYLVVVLAAAVLGSAVEAGAADGKFSGYMFGDYYYVASGPDKEENGFTFRRIYLTYDTKLSDTFSARLRLEASDAGFGSGSKMEPVVKDAYLRYTSASGRRLYAGLSSTPTWSLTEGIWGYRSVEKTVLDLNKIGSSRDFGLAFQSKLDAAGRVDVMLMAGNGNSNKSEGDTGKKLYARLHASSKSGFGIAGYADWESRSGDSDRLTFDTFLYGKTGSATFGLEGFAQHRKGARDIWVKGLSAFAHADLQEKSRGFVRADYLDPDDGTTDDRELRFIAGIDISAQKNVHVMPNVLVHSSQAPGTETVWTPRVTLFYKF